VWQEQPLPFKPEEPTARQLARTHLGIVEAHLQVVAEVLERAVDEAPTPELALRAEAWRTRVQGTLMQEVAKLRRAMLTA
jgi:hypothetical protein